MSGAAGRSCTSIGPRGHRHEHPGRNHPSAGLTLLRPNPYFDPVIRLVLAVLCALGVALGPLATSGAIAGQAAMPGCKMGGHMPAKPADHSKMDCCTPACQVTSPAILLPDRATDSSAIVADGALHDRTIVPELASFSPSGLDPPPRLPS